MIIYLTGQHTLRIVRIVMRALSTQNTGRAKSVAGKSIKLNLEAGNLPAWACHQAERMGNMRSFQPGTWSCVGFSNAARKVKRDLRAAGVGGNYLEQVLRDIIDLAYLNGKAA
jgi:hypothetical protein